VCGDETNTHDVVCLGPRDVPSVEGDDAGERAERAAEVAHLLEADVLVYGTVSQERGQVSAQPAVYIAARRLPQLDELSGAHELVSTAGYIGTGPERRVAVDALLERVTNLTRVMFTLDEYNLGNPEEAQELLQALHEDDDWAFDGYIVELITGNVWLKVGNWD